MTSIILARGFVNGGCAAYLQERMENSGKANEQWTCVAFQVNHLLISALSNVKSLSLASSSLGVFSVVVQTACALTPVAMLADTLYCKDVVPFSEKTVKLLNTVYQVGVIVNSLAMLALGSPVFALASLSMLALNALVSGRVKDIFDDVKKFSALYFLVGFGAKALREQGTMASIVKGSAVLVGMKEVLSYLHVPPVVPTLPLKSEEPVIQSVIQEGAAVKKEIVPEIVQKTVEAQKPVVEDNTSRYSSAVDTINRVVDHLGTPMFK